MVASALLLLPLLVAGSTSVDTFGSVQFLPTLPGSRSWNSAHWANGKSRTVE